MRAIATLILFLFSASFAHGYAYQTGNPMNLVTQEAQLTQKTAEQQAREAELAREAYCMLNSSADQCKSSEIRTAAPLQCPAGKISSGGPPQSATCIDDPNAATPGSNSEETPARDRTTTANKTVTTPENVPVPSARPTQDELVTSAQQNQANSCQQKASAATSACQTARNQISQLQTQVASLNTGSESTASACKNMQERAASVGSQMQNYRGQCDSAVSQCESVCGAAVSALGSLQTSAAYVKATGGRSSCASNRSSIAAMNVNIQQAHEAATRAQQCYQAATGGNNDSPSSASNNSNNNSNNTANNNQQQNNNGGGWQMPDFSGLMNANQNPGTTTTQVQDAPQNCSNPTYASQNPVCICRNNPSDPMCGGTIATGSDLGTARKDYNPTSNNPGNSSPDTLTLGEETPTNKGAQIGKLSRYQGQGGGGGTSGMGSGGGNSLPSPVAAKGWKYGTGRADSPGSGGSWGAGGGRKNSGQAWSPEEGYTRGQGGSRAGSAAAPVARKQVDLRRFLPSANGAPTREPSSVTGIGLKHTDIFRTVRDRYGRKAESLNP